MPVPEEIRKIPRPVNTIVDDNGRPGRLRYAVRERAGSKYIPGGNTQPRNGRVIGHIIEGEYVPVKSKTAQKGPNMLSYGSSALIKSISGDLIKELLQVYPAEDAYKIIVIAALQVISPGLPAKRAASEYGRTYISVFYPDVALSRNTISSFYTRLGMDGQKRKDFYQKRADAVIADHHIAIDGTLKKDTSIVNDLSAFSYKGRVKGCKEISVLYAYDIEEMEPVCAQVFPGNCIDAASYSKFIRENDIKKGVIVSDKGFPPGKIKDELEKRPDLHFLTPIKRNDVRIKNNNMLDYEGVLTGIGERVQYKKCCIKNGLFLYAFRNAKKAAAEDTAFIARSEDKKTYDQGKYKKKAETFGVIVFESDQDLPPETIYRCYQDRWLLELVFNRYKTDDRLDKTNVHGDFSVIGSEFVNFFSTVMTCRILRLAEKAGVLEDCSYGDLMDNLTAAWRAVDAPTPPKTDDEYWFFATQETFEQMEALGVCESVPGPEQRKRGRPKTKKEEDKPKRKRGRPRKEPASDNR